MRRRKEKKGGREEKRRAERTDKGGFKREVRKERGQEAGRNVIASQKWRQVWREGRGEIGKKFEIYWVYILKPINLVTLAHCSGTKPLFYQSPFKKFAIHSDYWKYF